MEVMVTKEGARNAIEQVALGNMERLSEVIEGPHAQEDIKRCAMTMVVATMMLHRSAPEMWNEMLDVGAKNAEYGTQALLLADQANAELKEISQGAE